MQNSNLLIIESRTHLHIFDYKQMPLAEIPSMMHNDGKGHLIIEHFSAEIDFDYVDALSIAINRGLRPFVIKPYKLHEEPTNAEG